MTTTTTAPDVPMPGGAVRMGRVRSHRLSGAESLLRRRQPRGRTWTSHCVPAGEADELFVAWPRVDDGKRRAGHLDGEITRVLPVVFPAHKANQTPP
jgi:hypothetical protein